MTCRPCGGTHILTYQQTDRQTDTQAYIHKSIQTYSYTNTWLCMCFVSPLWGGGGGTRGGWIIYIRIPGTQMTPVLIGQDLILEGSMLKIEDKQVSGISTANAFKIQPIFFKMMFLRYLLFHRFVTSTSLKSITPCCHRSWITSTTSTQRGASLQSLWKVGDVKNRSTRCKSINLGPDWDDWGLGSPIFLEGWLKQNQQNLI